MPVCNEKNKEGATALHVAAAHRCSVDVLRVMVETEFAERRLTLTLSNRGRTPVSVRSASVYRFIAVHAQTSNSFQLY